MTPQLVRVVRTPSSERYLIQPRAGVDAAALDLHYLADGSVAGTLVLFEESGISDQEIPGLLRHVDESLLPHVSLEDRTLSFTVVRGRVLGAYVPDGQ